MKKNDEPMTQEDYFKLYNTENPEIYAMFVAYTYQLISTGATRFSAYLIFERMRWETMVSGNDGYKLNNNYRPYYARQFMKDHPQYEGFFETRRTVAEGAR